MEKSFVIAGFGGQGVMLAGKLLAQAGVDCGLDVTWLPSYGPEMRGGTANCTVLLSDGPIGSPVVDNPTTLVAMNLPSLDRFEKTVVAEGIIVVNSSLITRSVERSDVHALRVPASDIAVSLGNPQVANMVVLGAVVKATAIIPFELMKTAMARMIGHNIHSAKLIAVNEQALSAGYDST